MRQEMYEYPFDWMMAKSVGLVTQATENSRSETEQMFKYLPYFNKTLDVFFRQGDALKPFFKMANRWIDEYYNAEKYGMKRVLSTFITNPIVFHAMNLNQINVELLTVFANYLYHRGAYDFMDLCVEKGFTETSCSAQRGTLGAYLAGMAKDFDAVVCNTPGTCDTNANSFAFISNYFKKPFYFLDFPSRLPGEDVVAYQNKDYKSLVAWLEKTTGHTMDFDKLAALFEETDKQQAIIQEIQEMMTVVPCPLPSFYNFMLYVGYNIMLGQPEYTELLEAMRNVAKRNLKAGVAGTPSGKEKARGYVIYIDHYNADMAYWNWMDEFELTHLGMAINPTFYRGQPYLKGNEEMGWHADTSNKEAMLNSLADMGARQPMARSVRGPYDGPNMWLEESLTMLKYYKADFAIFTGTYGCRNCWSNIQSMANDLEKHGYPTIICAADSIDERPQSWVQTQAEMEEFLNVRGIV